MSRPVAPWIRLFGIWLLRVELRSLLVAEGEMEMVVAVDGLQSAAEQYGLVDAWGQDVVQDVLGGFFARSRECEK